jgi:hypothetical protein
MARYPEDQFDDLPDDLSRVGAHRAPAKRGSGWITFAWSALATGILLVVVLVAISLLTDTSEGTEADGAEAAGATTSTATATAAPVEPITEPTGLAEDRDITIAILNGTTIDGLGDEVYAALDDDGWPVDEASNARQDDVETTIVDYTDAANEDVARGIVEALGVGDIRLTDEEIDAPVRVLLGTDADGAIDAE